MNHKGEKVEEGGEKKENPQYSIPFSPSAHLIEREGAERIQTLLRLSKKFILLNF
jgi:hypothetical protein